jgi:hypothetical protein
MKNIVNGVALVVVLSAGLSAQGRMTARAMLASADSLALTYAANAEFVSVTATDVDTMGRSTAWTYTYLLFDTANPGNSQMLYFVAQNGQVTLDHTGPFATGVSVMSDYWMDSDSALFVIQQMGGSDIVRMYPTCTVTAWVGQSSGPPFVSYWQVDYTCPDGVRWFRINAATGELLNQSTSIDHSGAPEIPGRFELFDCYPNPFNPSTTIRFSVPTRSRVRLTIFNLLGQKELANGELNAGNYARMWNANFASGLYFYRIEAVSVSDPGKRFVEVKKMLLLR